MRERELKLYLPCLIKPKRKSLPMRERELKPLGVFEEVGALASLPMRERELKLPMSLSHYTHNKSLPMRERELKPSSPYHTARVTSRSPCGSVN